MFLEGKNPRLFLFSRRAEALNLGLPFLFLPFALIAFAFEWSFGSNEKIFLALIAGILFVHSAHTVFTIANVIELPEYRNWIHARYKGRMWIPILRWTGLFAFVFSATLAGYYCLHSYAWFANGFTAETVAIVFTLASINHLVAQFMGLSLLYNRKIALHFKLSAVEQRRLGRHGAIERWLFRFLIFICVAGKLLEKFGPEAAWPAIRFSYFMLIAALMVGIFWNAYLVPKSRETNKCTFLVRVLFSAYASTNFALFITARALHGIEYLFVCRKIRANSSHRSNLWGVGALAIGIGVLITVVKMSYFIFRHARHDTVFALPHVSGLTLAILAAVINAEGLLHYHLDRISFKFSDPDVRTHLGSLLIDPPIAATAEASANLKTA